MNDLFFTASKRQTVTRLISVIMIVFFLMPLAVLAEEEDEDEAPASGRSAGSRGCGTLTQETQPTIPSLILLTPESPARTVLSRPTFVWHVRDHVTVPIIFRLYMHQENHRYELVKEIKDEQLKTTSGMMALSWPNSSPPLSSGRYRWQVSLVCDPSRPSGNLFAESDLDLVPIPRDLRLQLENTPNVASQARVYSQANFWFDALGIAFTSAAQSPSNHSSQKELQSSILDQMMLTDSERQVLQSSEVHSIQR